MRNPIKPLFEALATELENTTFTYEDYNVPLGGFTKLPMTLYNLETMYKGYSIQVQNEFGNHNLGNVNLVLQNKTLPEFDVVSGNHFTNLFLRKKDMLTVKCRNIAFKKFLEQKLQDSNLQRIAKDNLFEPKITNKSNQVDSHIHTLYHLEFSEKIGAIKAIINFYKDLIDY